MTRRESRRDCCIPQWPSDVRLKNLGMLAVHGDPATAAKLLRVAEPPATALGRFGFEQASALVASLQANFDLAEQHLLPSLTSHATAAWCVENPSA
jgi:Flp pilus assembly protein TadD